MCALCGVIGGNQHWADAPARPGAYSRTATAIDRRRERMSRVQIVNRVLKPLGMKLSDWQGAAFLLSTATGKSEVVDDLGHLWMAAERLSGRPCDPLALPLIELLEARHG